MNNKNYYFSNDSVNDRINKEKINISDIDLSLKIINMACKDIAKEKTGKETNIMLIEELSELIKAVEKLETELIKAVVKLERWGNRETTLRYNIYNNLYEELADVIIMMLQFIYKNNIECEELLNKMCIKLIRYYETKQE